MLKPLVPLDNTPTTELVPLVLLEQPPVLLLMSSNPVLQECLLPKFLPLQSDVAHVTLLQLSPVKVELLP